MSAQNPYKATGITGIIYFSLSALICLPTGLYFVLLSDAGQGSLLFGLLCLGIPIIGLIACALIIPRGPNKLSLILFGLLSGLLLTALLYSFFILKVGFENTVFFVLFAVFGLFTWLTWTMWKHIKNPVSIAIMETFQ